MATKKKDSTYGDQSIIMLKGPDRVRKRPGVIFGSDGLEGCEHSVFEILSNAVDEAKEGFGSEIRVRAFADHSIEVDDRGRGVPLGWNEAEGKFNWELIYCEMYAGGKYNNNSGDSSYEFSLGLNGLGACATQYASEWMEVASYNGESVSRISFKKGFPASELVTEPLDKKSRRTGTTIRWLPDLEVFADINIPKEYFTEVLKKQSIVNPRIKFILEWETAEGEFDVSEYYYENGIIDYVSELTGGDSMTAPVLWHLETMGRDRADKDEYKLRADISFCISNTVNAVEYYHNSSFLEHGGSPDKAVRSAFVFAVDKYLKTQEKYNKNESKITYSDVEDCLVLVINSQSTQTSYENQTKKAITNTFIKSALEDFLKRQLEVYFAENPLEAERMAGQILVNKRSRERAEETRIKIKTDLTGKIDIANRIDKFVGCRSKDPERRELYIVEGDSALTSCKLGRAAEFQAIIAVRGKTLNCLKSGYDKIFKSEVITNLIKVIGCGAEIEGKVKGDIPKFDYDALRWSKIIICTDADEDGYQIRTLILTMFYRLLPTLIKKGKVYIAESPLFEITCKDKIQFAYNEQEKADIIKKLGNAKYSLQRSKGLGENEPEMMWETTMNPETRRLIKVNETDAEETYRIFNTLLGDDLESRKEYITLYGNQYYTRES
ncbi:MAG: DNA topoisomerase [Ruminococcaceae bacterium]|nr:DNA topoisomerase [Oscillospiraceae bacterium]